MNAITPEFYTKLSQDNKGKLFERLTQLLKRGDSQIRYSLEIIELIICRNKAQEIVRDFVNDPALYVRALKGFSLNSSSDKSAKKRKQETVYVYVLIQAHQ